MNDVKTPAVTQQRGLLRLVWGIVISPRATFAYLREHSGRSWLIVAAILLFLGALLPLVRGPIAAQQAREAMIQQMESQPAFGGEIDIDQVTAFAASPLVTMVIPTIFAVFGLAVGWLLWSGALYLLASITGGRGSFGQVLQIVIWANVPYGIRNLLQTIYVSVTGTLIQNPGLSGFVSQPQSEGALFTPPRAELMVLRDLLGQVEIYLFWHLALLIIGLMAMAQLPRRKAIGLTLTVWAVFQLLRLAWVAISAGLAGGFAA